ncbi:MAG TPA: lysine--tRNA ligase [Candidatus Pacearchaeota archaeon]|nr:lysine--tRNA ligase [Candidatus Pacearchaeota archaeon]HOL90592.1 lysine--tRNA ligase [Candidatus Pacearchaeota archaeon]HPO68606.1 lysine--tRNA ligase [Candidatus Pacearchaeota archaeon]
MPPIDEIRKKRIEKLKKINDAGFFAYPISTKRNYRIKDAIKDFSSLSRSKKEIVLAGRILSLREHGSIVFSDIYDGSDKIQILFRKNILGEKSYQFFLDNFDIGDFIEARGTLFKTKTKEKTLEVNDYKILAKSLLPLPEKWHGLKDVEERFRKRYLDLIFNQEVKKKFELRSLIIKEIRNFLDKEGFIEVETPILQPVYGGASARPFKTHLNALNIDLYLRIAPELYLKRLLVGGFEKIYEIGKCFRNEGMDKNHNPDFTMIEFYWAYADYKQLMKLTEKLFSYILKKAFKKNEITFDNKKINFKTPWQRIEFNDLIKKYTKINLDEINEESLKKEAIKLGIMLEKGDEKAQIADKIYKKYCQINLWQPTFVIHHPVGMAPLAKKLEENPKKLARFQLVAGGIELVNAFSELNDPIEQRERFKEQEKIFKKGFEEAQRMDEDFLEALEYGMPLAAGFGMGIDRLIALLTDSHSIREVILFPTMRPK